MKLYRTLAFAKTFDREVEICFVYFEVRFPLTVSQGNAAYERSMDVWLSMLSSYSGVIESSWLL